MVTLDNNFPIEYISKMLGHTNLHTTQIYAKVLKVDHDMKKLEERLNNRKVSGYYLSRG
jgi:site-specific recombinase XerD